MYLGTPHHGSNGADIMKTLLDLFSLFGPSNINIVKDMRPFTDFLQMQSQLYKAISANYITYFCYETVPTRLPGGPTSLIVPKESAKVVEMKGALELALPADHIKIAKATSSSDVIYRLLEASLCSIAEEALLKCRNRWKTFEGEQLLSSTEPTVHQWYSKFTGVYADSNSLRCEGQDHSHTLL
jgi:hypothetical protein